jgi:hypothetical protein
MICKKCGKDKVFWTEMQIMKRIDNSPTYYSMFRGRLPKTYVLCNKCAEERYLFLSKVLNKQ